MSTNSKYPEVLNLFIEELRREKKSENTIKCYGDWIYNFIQFEKSIKYNSSKLKSVRELEVSNVKNSLFKSINKSDIDKYKDYLTEIGNEGNSINRKLGSLKTFFEFLKESKIVESNIMVEIKKVKQSKKKKKSLSQREAELLLNTICNSNSKYKERDAFLFLLFIDLGARETELTTAKINQLYDDNKYMVLVGKGDKERIVYLNNKSREVLRRYLVSREQFLKDHNIKSDYLFLSQHSKNISTSRVFQMLKDYAELAGIDREKISPHILRHTSASLKYRNGVGIVELKDILGHESISTTQLYIDADEQDIRDSANKVKFDINF